ncbi:MAG: P-loop NTPase [Candidatus Buchananbacteria bacterium]|nr:P-loop NTPase [Candidatus Buchananbacteria bacterium]
MNKNKQTKLVIASGKGGVGKSMLTSSLAILFNQHKKIIAVDCDVDAPNLAIWLNEAKDWQKIQKISTAEKAIVNYKKCIGCGSCAKNCQFKSIKMAKNKPQINVFTCEGCGLCEIICPTKAISLHKVKNGEIKTKKTKYNFPLITGQLYPGETGSGKVIDQVIQKAKNYKYDLMLIDSSPGTGCPVIASLKEADKVLLITEPTPSGFSDLKKILQVVNHFAIPYFIIINKWDINKNLSLQIKKWAGKNLLGQISYNPEIFDAISQFKPLMETDLKTKNEIISIYKKLIKLL